MRWPALTGPCDWALIFFCCTRDRQNVIHLNFFLRQMTHCLILPRFQPLWWVENRGRSCFYLKTCFSTYFNQKYLNNHDKFIYDLKKKTIPKTEINPKQKINRSSNLFFHKVVR
jgi:hypothetical protein